MKTAAGAKRRPEPAAGISEVFSSFQGEGLLVGVKQIFIRFHRCNRNCVFCDVPGGLSEERMTAGDVLGRVKELERRHGPHHSVALTGGEPLLYQDFLAVFLPRLRKDFPVYLETNGTLPAALKRIIGRVDWVAMDVKLPSSTGESGCWKRHQQFLRAARKKRVFVKVVVTASSTMKDVRRAAALIRRIDRDVPLVIQPAAAGRGMKIGIPSREKLVALTNAAAGMLNDVRLIPQAHKMLNLP